MDFLCPYIYINRIEKGTHILREIITCAKKALLYQRQFTWTISLKSLEFLSQCLWLRLQLSKSTGINEEFAKEIVSANAPIVVCGMTAYS